MSFYAQQLIASLPLRQCNLAAGNCHQVFRDCLQQAKLQLDQAFLDGQPVAQLLAARTLVVDQLISNAWQHFGLENHSNNICLLAVGGYGRAELHPFSDIDLLVLMKHPPNAALQEQIGLFLTFLWDIGLDIGHAVRTLEQCLTEAKAELSVITNLLESRTVIGCAALQQQLLTQLNQQQIWPASDFLAAKQVEQKQRHHKFNDTEYNLEPDVKSSPGALRDIQTLLWLAQRLYGSQELSELARPGLLSHSEVELLQRSREYLWWVRYALHMLAGRREDRLLLDYQHKIAQLAGFTHTDSKLAIEQFMQQYYRTVMTIAELSDFTAQIFSEQQLAAAPITQLNPRFQLNNGYLEHCSTDLFSQQPSALLEIFVLLAQQPQIIGVKTNTIRLMREHLHLIDDSFRQNPAHTELFIELFKCNEGVHKNLRRMNRYGILGRYLPEFGKIIGQMQHDLFHIYTVDAHTLNLIKHLRKLRHPDFAEKYSLAGAIINRLPKIHVLYLAGLYHDIAKGRGGDHSELGAVDAYDFAVRHQLADDERKLMVWLVRNHLLMSETAQRKDISDPEEIHNFSLQVGDQQRLDYLYVLTVADINATNPKLWNSWRAHLLRQLYGESRRALRRGLENPLERAEQLQTRQATALSLLAAQGIALEQVQELWQRLGDDYFLRHNASDIAWHSQALLQHNGSQQPLVLVSETTWRGFDGGSQIFVYAPQRRDLFAATTALLDQLNLSIQDARIMTSSAGFTIETYVVLEADGGRIGHDQERIQQIRQRLSSGLAEPENFPKLIQRRVSRRLQHFAFSPHINIHNDAQRPYTVVEVVAPDRPGLLAKIGKVFLDFNLSVLSAKVITQGERIEDVFFITDQHGQPLADPHLCSQLQDSLCAQLSSSLPPSSSGVIHV